MQADTARDKSQASRAHVPNPQVLESNVRRGSPVFERGHFLVLAMAGSQRDRDVLWQLLTQARVFPSALS